MKEQLSYLTQHGFFNRCRSHLYGGFPSESTGGSAPFGLQLQDDFEPAAGEAIPSSASLFDWFGRVYSFFSQPFVLNCITAYKNNIAFLSACQEDIFCRSVGFGRYGSQYGRTYCVYFKNPLIITSSALFSSIPKVISLTIWSLFMRPIAAS